MKLSMHGTNRTAVQPRDVAFFRELAMLGIVDHDQARLVAGFGSINRTNKRLLKLVRAGLLRRFFLGSGSGRKALYALSEKGAHLASVPFRGLRRPEGAMLAADFFVEHQLAINAIYCAAKFGEAPLGIEFLRWTTFHAPILPELRLIPDGYLECKGPHGITTAFLEVDLATESLKVWREKTRQYLQLALSGGYERAFGQPRFRVLVIAPSARRLESLRTAIAGITEKIFRFGLLADAQQNFFQPIWKRPLGHQLEPLVETAP